MKQSFPPERVYDDEPLSLVDMAVIVLQYWRTMLIVIVGGTALSLLLAWFLPLKYEYISMYSVAEYITPDGETQSLEEPESLIARINNLYMEAERQQLLANINETSLPFKVEANSLSSSRLIMLESNAQTQHKEWLGELHQGILMRVKEHQDEVVQERRESLQTRLETTREQLERVTNSGASNADVLIIGYQERIAELEILLSQLHGGNLLQVASQRSETNRTNQLFVVALGIFLSVMLAPFVAVLLHFSRLVSAKFQKIQG